MVVNACPKPTKEDKLLKKIQKMKDQSQKKMDKMRERLVKAKPKKKPRQVSMKYLRDTAWKLLSKVIREEEHYICFTCGKNMQNDKSSCQAGHYVPRGKVSALRYHRKNVHAQCLTEVSNIKMRNGGYKSIKHLRIGDELIGFDDETFEIVSCIVESITSFMPESLYEIELENGERFYATPDHKVVANGEWIEIRKMLYKFIDYDIKEL